jgi:hypothetical protein
VMADRYGLNDNAVWLRHAVSCYGTSYLLIAEKGSLVMYVVMPENFRRKLEGMRQAMKETVTEYMLCMARLRKSAGFAYSCSLPWFMQLLML